MMKKTIKEVDFKFVSHTDLDAQEIEAFNNKFVEGSDLAKDVIFIESDDVLKSTFTERRSVNMRFVIGQINNINFETMKVNVSFFDNVPLGSIYIKHSDEIRLTGKYLRNPDDTLKLISYVAVPNTP